MRFIADFTTLSGQEIMNLEEFTPLCLFSEILKKAHQRIKAGMTEVHWATRTFQKKG
jgi:hypothetical protein